MVAHPPRCDRCTMPLACCVCPWVRSVDNRTPVFIIRHHVERLKTSNTARLCQLSLTRCTVVEYGQAHSTLEAVPLQGPGTWLLYPGRAEPTAGAPWPPTALVVPDGSWSQARKMVQRLPAVGALPRLPLPPLTARPFTLRRPLQDEQLPTVLAVAGALRLLDGPAVAEPLWELHEQMVQLVLRSKGVAP